VVILSGSGPKNDLTVYKNLYTVVVVKHIPYPSIEQFRSAIHKVRAKARQTGVDVNGDPVYDDTIPAPTLTYEGTVKLHGTNAAIGWRNGEGVWFQSRENVITLEKDNAGFVRSFEGKDLNTWLSTMFAHADEKVLFGEWCGGNIQPNVALSGLSKRFVIFAALIDGEWQSRSTVSLISSDEFGIENIYDYQTEQIEIDFNKPELSQNELVRLTTRVESECPFSKAHGISGIGEGIVWQCKTIGWDFPEYTFKVKGDAHANSKVTKLKTVNRPELNKAIEIAEVVTPPWRLSQMLEASCDLMNGGIVDRRKLGEYIRLVTADVEKEDLDIITSAGLEMKDVAGNISKIAKNYFFEQEKYK